MSAAGGPETRPGGLELRVGGRIWLDGQGWKVRELTGATARLQAGDVVRAVSISSLIGSSVDEPEQVDPSSPGVPTWDVPAVLVAGLTLAQRSALAERVEALRRVLEPAAGDERAILQRYDDEAAALGVSRRTLQRQAVRLLELGPAGLVDSRLLQQSRRSVDPRWDSACLNVLAAHVNASNPTRQAVIDRANREFLQQVPDGKVPSTAVAYRWSS